MEAISVALQQAGSQTNTTLSMLKSNAKAEQALVSVIAQSSPSGGRGQNLDITV